MSTNEVIGSKMNNVQLNNMLWKGKPVSEFTLEELQVAFCDLVNLYQQAQEQTTHILDSWYMCRRTRSGG